MSRPVFRTAFYGTDFPVIDFPVYDSRQIFPETYSGRISQEDFVSLKVPSTRYYYIGSQGAHIPLPSTELERGGRNDLMAWSTPITPVVYAPQVKPPGDPVIDFQQILSGTRIHPVPSGWIYLQGISRVLEDNDFGELSRYSIAEELLKYPVNRVADLQKAYQLSQTGTEEEIQQYLDDRGVRHFRASELQGLPLFNKVFYLSRFYPRPPQQPLSEYLLIRRYLERINDNNRLYQIVIGIPRYRPVYEKFRDKFDILFEKIKENPDDLSIPEALGASDSDRFYNDFFNYLRLYGRPVTLPPLTFNTLRLLVDPDVLSLAEFLKDYTDVELISLTGERINEAATRRDLIVVAAQILLQTQYTLLLPIEAGLCRNSESLISGDAFKDLSYAFVGRGSFTEGFDCYNVIDLFEYWEQNKTPDGEYQFQDIVHEERNFTITDLEGFQEAFRQGRGGLPSGRAVANRLHEYLLILQSQISNSYNKIKMIRAWGQQSPENTQLLSDLWNSYFRMGMYMRQWKGPGNPYPLLRGETGEEAQSGTELEYAIMQRVGEEGISFRELMSRIPTEVQEAIWTLPIYDYRYGHWSEETKTSIRKRYEDVLLADEDDRLCIRLSSAPWAYTAAYYLKQTLNQEIPGFGLETPLEIIS